MSIGWFSPGSEADLKSDPLRDSIFPVLAPWWPGSLDQLLLERQQGAWRFDLLTPPRMLRLHLLQAAGPTHSFSQALREIWHAWGFRGWVKGPPPSTGSLAEARRRVPLWAWEALLRHTAGRAEHFPGLSYWPRGRTLTIDATPVRTPRSPANYMHWGAPRNQLGEAYYPQATAVWLALQPGGVILAHVLGTHRQGEERLAPALLQENLRPGDLLLGDARFGTYAILATVLAGQGNFLCRAAGPWRIEQHVVRTHAPDDVDLTLNLSAHVSTHHPTLVLPPRLDLRGIRLRIPARHDEKGMEWAWFLTTLPRADFSVPELGTMTRLRWCHETLQNDVKTRLGLGEVRSQTPEGVLQEVLAHLCLSNFLRLWRHRACPLAPDLPSFTAAREALYQANQQLRAAPEQQAHILGLLEAMLCAQPVVHRPDRSEPRCRRPSKRPYPYFKSPRALWRAERKVG